MRLSGLILKAAGWKVSVKAPDFDKCVVCVAPHTSNWDFVLGILSWWSVGRKAGFLMKDSWFFFPLGYLFKALGGIPVPRGRKRKGRSLVDTLVDRFNTAKQLNLAVTPEGTRSRVTDWHTGFLQIALRANVPVLLGVIDYEKKLVMVNEVFTPSGDIDKDMRLVKDYYKPFSGRYPEKFCAD